MLAIDTNVLVRLLTRDHPLQYRRVVALMATEPLMISSTVLLETDWVLRSTYGLSKGEVIKALQDVVSLPNVNLREHERALKALSLAASGMDFADALHLAASDGCEAFLSFDKRLKKSADLLALPVREP